MNLLLLEESMDDSNCKMVFTCINMTEINNFLQQGHQSLHYNLSLLINFTFPRLWRILVKLDINSLPG